MVRRRKKTKKKGDQKINTYRNGEYYYDPTAGKAIENIEKERKKKAN